MKSILLGSLLVSIALVGSAVYLNQQTEAEDMLTAAYPTILIETHKQQPPNGRTINQPYMEDAIRIRADGQSVTNNRIYDTACDRLSWLRNRAHRDAIQLIPTKNGFYNYQMMGGRMSNIRIIGNQIQSNGKLQGVFASDGSFANIIVQNNKIMTNSQHQVAINGLLTGTISGNTNHFGGKINVELEPMRIGGNIFTGNVWILGFANGELNYAPVSSIVRDGSLTRDTRRTKTRPRDINLVNFRYNAFFSFIQRTPLRAISGGWANDFNNWMRNLYAKRGREGVTDARIQNIRRAVSAEANTPIYRVRNTDLLMFALQQAAKRHGTRA